MFASQGGNQGNRRYNFTDRDSMQPYAAWVRPSERSGQKSESLTEVGPVLALRREPGNEVENGGGRQYELT